MNEREILQESIGSHQNAIDKAQAELAELDKPDKPKLRHGDYGYDKSGKFTLVCKEAEGVLRAGREEGFLECMPIENLDSHLPETILGNIFDDLKRNSEDLKKFTVYGDNDPEDNAVFKAEYDGTHIWLASTTDGAYFEVADIVRIHQKLGQLIATARRKAK